MKVQSSLFAAIAAVAIVLFAASSYAADPPHYLITNNDFAQGNSATFYAIFGNGVVKQKVVVDTGGTGVNGIGAVSSKRVSILHDATQQCAFIPDAGSADVAGISITTLTATGAFKAASTDSAPSGMPVGNNGRFLYAGFTGSSTLATYRILPGCTLQFVQDVAAAGLAGGVINDLSVHRRILVASFTDGSIASFDISAGVPVANGDLQYSTGHTQNGNFPSGVDISSDGHFAIFGGTNSPPMVEVSDISSGKLEPTVVYSNLGDGGGSEAIRLSPDESLLYVSNFSTTQVTAAFFDKNTGAVTYGCISPTLKPGGGTFMAGLATSATTGTGSVLFAFEVDAGIGVVRVGEGSGTCSLSPSAQTPVADGQFDDSAESIGVFPPRPF